jgi:hypothetical protein
MRSCAGQDFEDEEDMEKEGEIRRGRREKNR